MASFFAAPRSPFHEPTFQYQLVTSPIALLARLLYDLLLGFRPRPRSIAPAIRVVCISDSHTQTKSIPPGDVLIHAGDLCNAGTPSELRAQIQWLESLPHSQKVVVAGNHDTWLDPRSRKTLSAEDQDGQVDWGSLHYLQHSSIALELPNRGGRRLVVYGAPQIPALGGPQHAFQYSRGLDAWTETVPDETDILVTHTPPKYHLDLPPALGCEWLLRECRRVKPRLHVCGHVHDARGVQMLWWDGCQDAYERICTRSTGALSLFDPRNLIDIIRMTFSGLKGVAWALLWKGHRRGTTLVNAALMFQKTGKIENAPIIVDL